MTEADKSRTRVRRLPELQEDDRAALHAVLDEGWVAHVAFTDDAQPFCLPMAYVRDGNRLLLHGSTGSRLMRRLADGSPVCVAITLLDGLVVARSAFESSMQYRSAVVFGRCSPVRDVQAALRTFTEGLLPGRWDEVRPPVQRELAATMVLELPLDEWSVKVSAGDPEDPPEDVATDAWAGVLPMTVQMEQPRPAADLRPGIGVPGSVERLM